MSEESKEADAAANLEALEDALKEAKQATAEDAGDEGDSSAGEEDEQPAPANGESAAAGAAKKKKRSKKKKLKQAILGSVKSESMPKTAADLTSDQLNALLDVNPALKAEVNAMDPKNVQEMMKRLNLADLLTGLSVGGKNKKDMASYKFWQTQPVQTFQDREKGSAIEDGPLKVIDIDRVRKEPYDLPDGFVYVTMDLDDEVQLKEVYELLVNHYVEDDEAMFRFNYSISFLNWALKAPGWTKEWHIGVRTTGSNKLVAFISGIPMSIRVRANILSCSEINFLCIHKKLRSKRLAPELIKEVTRRCYIANVYQAIYTGGVILPTPVSTCRYFHRSLDWEKLFEVGFSPLPPGSTKTRQVSKYKLPTDPLTPNLRPMKREDAKQVLDLLTRYLQRSDLTQMFNKEEVVHWLMYQQRPSDEQVVWSYVVEDPETKKITDFFSFYCLESTVIGKNKVVRAAYLFYYATDAAFQDDKKVLKVRLNALMKDALILAKRAKFDVMNALTLMDNPLFLEEQKFGAGDGQLHYYLFNYRTAPIAGGIDQRNQADEKFMDGVGLVML
ncbi:N-myristoyl transferase [Aulographum hederae CBS 113979]|uniref:Glycylpeptide N-tetradecanoyltransferase n=1 Tax=Aulographum hederae CBS 113979 TaxID=1176131 RepID=A0A6G1HBD7_9PEZI|nr:N-myristoyl transferase [Aulographum hederae CBS 113979]